MPSVELGKKSLFVSLFKKERRHVIPARFQTTNRFQILEFWKLAGIAFVKTKKNVKKPSSFRTRKEKFEPFGIP